MWQSSLASDEDPIRHFGPPVADEVAPTPYCEVQRLFDDAFIRGRRYSLRVTLAAGLIAAVSLVAAPPASRADDSNNGSGSINEKGVLSSLGANAVLSNGSLSQVTTITLTTTTNTNTYTSSSHNTAAVNNNYLYSNSNTGADHTGIVDSRSDANVVINSGAVAMANSMGGQGILQASQNTGANAVQQQAVTLNSAVGGNGGGLSGFGQPIAGTGLR
jgi:hypothetical protein